MNDDPIVWSDESGDLRKNKPNKDQNQEIDLPSLVINIRRLTSGKGRTIIELSCLPANKNWCKKLAKDLKKSLGVGGSYKNNLIEIHGEKLELVTNFLSEKNFPYKKIGG